LFNKNFENDISAWKKIRVQAIHAAAKKILASNSKALHGLGPDAGKSIYIKSKNGSLK
jgi:hypothetical protein